MGNQSTSTSNTTGTIAGDLEVARRKAKRSATENVNDFVHWIFALMFSIPGSLVALHLLIGNDLRYWPAAVPVSYAPIAGVLLLAASALLIWATLKNHLLSNRT